MNPRLVRISVDSDITGKEWGIGCTDEYGGIHSFLVGDQQKAFSKANEMKNQYNTSWIKVPEIGGGFTYVDCTATLKKNEKNEKNKFCVDLGNSICCLNVTDQIFKVKAPLFQN